MSKCICRYPSLPVVVKLLPEGVPPRLATGYRDFETRGRRRQRKLRLRNEFAFFQSLSPLFLPTYSVKCRRTLPKLNYLVSACPSSRKRKTISSSLVYILTVLHKMWNWIFSRRSRAVTAKKFTKKRAARAELLFCLLNLLLLLTFSLLSASSDLNVPYL